MNAHRPFKEETHKQQGQASWERTNLVRRSRLEGTYLKHVRKLEWRDSMVSFTVPLCRLIKLVLLGPFSALS